MKKEREIKQLQDRIYELERHNAKLHLEIMELNQLVEDLESGAIVMHRNKATGELVPV